MTTQFINLPDRHRFTVILTIISTVALYACGGESTPKNKNPSNTPSPANTEVLIQGGLLWDEVWGATGIDPSAEPNPLYEMRLADPSTGQKVTQSPANTWRCKECHGWDYKGKDGAYGEGSSHYTGFKGLLDKLSVLNASRIKSFVRDGYTTPVGIMHDYGTSGPALSDADLDALVAFILNGGIVDTELYIFPDGAFAKAGKCDQGNGQTLYETGAPKTVINCASSGCHGIDGKAIDFDSDPAAVEYVGTIGVDNPWELLHKVRFGQPGEPSMPAMLRWASIDQSCDLMTYTQTLPVL